jgi:hypothetical protein
MRCMTSEPAPLPAMIGTSPATMTATVIAFGRTRVPRGDRLVIRPAERAAEGGGERGVDVEPFGDAHAVALRSSVSTGPAFGAWPRHL